MIRIQYWQNQFESGTLVGEEKGGGLKLLAKTKPKIKIYDFGDIDFTESITSPTRKRQILDKLQAKLVVFNDRIEIRYQIPIEPDKSTNVILTLGL